MYQNLSKYMASIDLKDVFYLVAIYKNYQLN